MYNRTNTSASTEKSEGDSTHQKKRKDKMFKQKYEDRRKKKKSVKNMFINSVTFIELKKRKKEKEEVNSKKLKKSSIQASLHQNIKNRKSILELFQKTEEITNVSLKAINRAKLNYGKRRVRDTPPKKLNPLKGTVIEEKIIFTTIEKELQKKNMKITKNKNMKKKPSSGKLVNHKKKKVQNFKTFNDIFKSKRSSNRGSHKKIEKIKPKKKGMNKYKSLKNLSQINSNKEKLKKIGLGKKFSENFQNKSNKISFSEKKLSCMNIMTKDNKTFEKLHFTFKKVSTSFKKRKENENDKTVSKRKKKYSIQFEKSGKKILEKKNMPKNKNNLTSLFSKNRRRYLSNEKTGSQLSHLRNKQKGLRKLDLKRTPGKKFKGNRSISPLVKSSRLYLSRRYSPLDSHRKYLKQNRSNDNSLTRVNRSQNFETLEVVKINQSSKKRILSFLREQCYYMRDLKQYFREKDRGYFGLLFNQHFENNFKALKLFNKVKFFQPNKFFEIKPKYKKKGKLTLVLDLDETLIHCFPGETEEYQKKIHITQQSGSTIKVKLNIRPFVRNFLEGLDSKFEFILFTASRKYYADSILKHIDPENKFFSHRFYREDCFQTEQGFLVKDLSIIKNRNLDEIVIVDNSTSSFLKQFENGIPIIPYFCKKDDIELIKLRNFLLNLHKAWEAKIKVKDVLKRYFKFGKYLDGENVEQVYSKLFLRD